MNTTALSTLLLPEWLLPWLLVLAVSAWILGARPVAIFASLILLFEIVVTPMVAPVLASIPAAALLLVAPVLALMVFQGVITLLFGKRTAGSVTGVYLVRMLDLLTLGPFRLLGRLLRGRAEP